MADYEKLYIDALENARDIHKDGLACSQPVKVVLETLFPELKESVDESIRKELIQYIKALEKTNNPYSAYSKIYLDWLERQAEKDKLIANKDKLIEELSEYKYTQEEQYVNKDKDDRIRNCIGMCLTDIGEQRFKDFDTTLKDCLTWLERKGEKSCKSPHKYNVGDWIVSKYNSIYQVKEVTKESYSLLNTNNVEEISFISQVDDSSRLLCMNDIQDLVKKQSKPNKLLKFKVGDWVVHKISESVEQITKIHMYGDGSYGYYHTNGYFSEDFEKDYHLWTIQDAKDGDILHSSSHHLIWIYKDNEHYYACVNMNYVTKNVETNVTRDGQIIIPTDVCPATSDECAILFNMLNYASYEWDAEKKKLNKI